MIVSKGFNRIHQSKCLGVKIHFEKVCCYVGLLTYILCELTFKNELYFIEQW